MANVAIHPSSIVESGAKIGKDVVIGPFCYIESDVTIGNNCHIMSHVVIKNGTTIKAGAKIFPHAILGCDPQNSKHKGGYTSLIIGENCLIREGVTMHKGSDNSAGTTIIGDNCSFLAYAHVAHDCVIGNYVTFANNVMIGGHVTIGDHAILGGGAAVHQLVRVGHNAFVGGLAALTCDLIPYGTAIGVHAHFGGLNIIGMKRNNIERRDIHNLRHAVQMLFSSQKTLKENLAEVKKNYEQVPIVASVITFIEQSQKRSLCKPKI